MSFQDLTELRRKYSGQAGQLVSEFYVPVLKTAVRYDRQAGYFDSASLVQIAEGVARFIGNVRERQAPGWGACRGAHDGRERPEASRSPMRVITGATWSYAFRGCAESVYRIADLVGSTEKVSGRGSS